MNLILSVGLVFLLGILVARIINKIRLPSVTAYLLLGIICGPFFFNIISDSLLNISGLVSNLVLGLIAFSIGQNFSLPNFRKIGKAVVFISIFESLLTWIIVTSVFLFLLEKPFYVAVLFGAIASATAPAATVMVVRQFKSKGRFTNTLLGVVAIDDAWCLIIFAVSLAIAKVLVLQTANGLMVIKIIGMSLVKIAGAFVLGGGTALVLSGLSKFIRTRSDLLTYTLGFVFLTIGISVLFNLSVLLAVMFMGAVLVNINKASFKFFNIIKEIDSPIYIVFFVLAGANLEVHLLQGIGLLSVVYLASRLVGKMGGAWLGAYFIKAEKKVRNFLWMALMPQAGVALGCALIVKSSFPDFGGVIFTTLISTTIIYELAGPLFTSLALKKSGESLSVENSQG